MAQGSSRWGATSFAMLVGLTSCLAPAQARRPSAPVPPTQEIEILDPNVEPNGNPAILTRKVNGFTTVEIPPSVLVHRFYYSGERTFQAQLLPGGPSVIVINHPKTGERVYVPVVLPPGAPKVKYHADSIVYDYGPQSVAVHFAHCGKSSVTYRQQGTELGDKVHKTAARMIENAKALVERTGIPGAVRELKAANPQLQGALADGIRETGRDLIGTPVRNGVRMLPGANAALPAPTPRPAP